MKWNDNDSQSNYINCIIKHIVFYRTLWHVDFIKILLYQKILVDYDYYVFIFY